MDGTMKIVVATELPRFFMDSELAVAAGIQWHIFYLKIS